MIIDMRVRGGRQSKHCNFLAEHAALFQSIQDARIAKNQMYFASCFLRLKWGKSCLYQVKALAVTQRESTYPLRNCVTWVLYHNSTVVLSGHGFQS